MGWLHAVPSRGAQRRHHWHCSGLVEWWILRRSDCGGQVRGGGQAHLLPLLSDLSADPCGKPDLDHILELPPETAVRDGHMGRHTQQTPQPWHVAPALLAVVGSGGPRPRSGSTSRGMGGPGASVGHTGGVRGAWNRMGLARSLDGHQSGGHVRACGCLSARDPVGVAPCSLPAPQQLRLGVRQAGNGTWRCTVRKRCGCGIRFGIRGSLSASWRYASLDDRGGDGVAVGAASPGAPPAHSFRVLLASGSGGIFCDQRTGADLCSVHSGATSHHLERHPVLEAGWSDRASAAPATIS
mmetsp:Transcript_21006/g.63201  ORF Transcript_21006/g.63201 Transcript_21006/m.63201 type:complete len:297 (-) Transcript_21006:210-1100(-)